MFSVCFLFNSSTIYGALVTVNPEGEMVWNVLGDVSDNLKIPQKPDLKITNVSTLISLNSDNGKIVLNNIDVSNIKDNLVEIEARPNSNNLKIKNDNGQFNIEENGINALTSFPITIDPVKNELAVETASGTRIISVLPYEATLTLIRNKTIDNVKDNKILLLENSKGELQYEVNGSKNFNLLNVISIKADITSLISASNGEVLEIKGPEWLKFVGFIFRS